MAIDTLKISSPTISEGLASGIERLSFLRQGVQLEDGVVMYSIITGELHGSYDARVSINVQRTRYKNVNGRPEPVPCNPYVMVECSAHKLLHGQNILGGPIDFLATCRAVVLFLSHLLAVKAKNTNEFYEDWQLPSADDWTVHRVDWAEMHALCPQGQEEFFRSINHSRFPRRKCLKYHTYGVYFPGDTTTVKIYSKGREFAINDRDRMRHNLNLYFSRKLAPNITSVEFCDIKTRELRHQIYSDAIETENYSLVPVYVNRKLRALQKLADHRLRVEVEVHAKKLRALFFDILHGELPKVHQLTDELLCFVFDDEIDKILKEGQADMETVRSHEAVLARLISVYGKRSANSLFSFWMSLAALGENELKEKEQYSRTQFYTNKTKLVQANISWLASNIYILPDQTALPKDFTPSRRGRYVVGNRISQNSVFSLDPAQFSELRERRCA